MSEETKEKKVFLTEKRMEELANMDYSSESRYIMEGDESQKIKNTIERLEADLKSIRGLKRFIEHGVLINDRLLISADSDDWRTNIFIRAFDNQKDQVKVDLTIAEAERFKRILPQAIKCARKKRSLVRLKKLWKDKKDTYRHRRY